MDILWLYLLLTTYYPLLAANQVGLRGEAMAGRAPPAVEEAAAPVGAAMPSSSIACAAGFGAEAGCWSAGELRGLRGL